MSIVPDPRKKKVSLNVNLRCRQENGLLGANVHNGRDRHDGKNQSRND